MILSDCCKKFSCKKTAIVIYFNIWESIRRLTARSAPGNRFFSEKQKKQTTIKKLATEVKMERFDEYLNDLKALIAIDSSKTKPEDGAPFGRGAADALKTFIAVAKRLGFTVIDYDGYVAEVVYGEGDEIGIIGHLDVVPASGNWTYPPFELTEKDGYLFGRGVADDKGPTLAALYALNELKNSGVKCNKKFRLFAGTNEESGWKDLEYLNTVTNLPKYGFSPDGDFPVSYAEKGVFHLIFPLPSLKNFYELSGGSVINAVCDKASVRAKNAADLAVAESFGLSVSDGNLITSVGKAAHGSAPHKGVNAFKALFKYLAACGEDVTDYYEYLFCDKAGVMELKNEQGNVTFSPDIIEARDGSLCLICDCRIPAPFDFVKDVKPLFDKTGLKMSFIEGHPVFMTPKNCELVRKLIGAYNRVTGENAEPVSLGGSTFARAFEQGCAFGVEFPGEEYHIHEPDERINIKLLLKAYDIIKAAIFDLAE